MSTGFDREQAREVLIRHVFGNGMIWSVDEALDRLERCIRPDPEDDE